MVYRTELVPIFLTREDKGQHCLALPIPLTSSWTIILHVYLTLTTLGSIVFSKHTKLLSALKFAYLLSHICLDPFTPQTTSSSHAWLFLITHITVEMSPLHWHLAWPPTWTSHPSLNPILLLYSLHSMYHLLLICLLTCMVLSFCVFSFSLHYNAHEGRRIICLVFMP